MSLREKIFGSLFAFFMGLVFTAFIFFAFMNNKALAELRDTQKPLLSLHCNGVVVFENRTQIQRDDAGFYSTTKTGMQYYTPNRGELCEIRNAQN